MVPVPTTYLNVPVFGGGASNIQPEGSTYAGGFLPGQLFPAEYENWLMNRLTTNSLASQTTNLSVAAEIVNILSQASITPDPASTTQLYAALNALYATVSALSSEASTRASADSTLQSNINAEATARMNADALLAPLASPIFTGTPQAPTPSPGDSSAKVATTGFVAAAVSALNLVIDQRTTTGSTSRTETVNALAVNQTALIEWACACSGSNQTLTFALPAGGTYQVFVTATQGTPGSMTGGNPTINTIRGENVAGGSSVAMSFLFANGIDNHLFGFVRRLS
jgi:hypothetical protein